MLNIAEEIDLTCSQEEDPPVLCTNKRKDVVNVIDPSPPPKKLCHKSSLQDGCDTANTNITRGEWKKICKRIQLLEEQSVNVHETRPLENEQYVTRQEFDELKRRITVIEERVEKVEQLIGSVKAAFLFPSTPKTELASVTDTTSRRLSADPQEQIAGPSKTTAKSTNNQTSGIREQTPPGSKSRNATVKHSNSAKSQRQTSISSGSGSIVNQNQQQETTAPSLQATLRRHSTPNSDPNTPNSMHAHPSTFISSDAQVNNQQQQKSMLSASSSNNSSNSTRVQNTNVEITAVPASQDTQTVAQRILDARAAIQESNGPPSKGSGLHSPSAGFNDTPHRNPSQRPSNVSQNKFSTPASSMRTSAPSTSRSSNALQPLVNHQSGSSSSHYSTQRAVNQSSTLSSTTKILPVGQNTHPSQKQNIESSSDWELPAEVLHNIQIKKEVECSQETRLWRRIDEHTELRKGSNLVIYIIGIGRKIRNHEKYIAVGGFTLDCGDRSILQSKSFSVPFVSDLNREDTIGPRLWDKLKTEALIMAAGKAIQVLKEKTKPNPLKLTIIASSSLNAKKFITIMQQLQRREILSLVYKNANKCTCVTFPCNHHNRWDTDDRLVNSFVCNYDLPKLCIIAEGTDITWREQNHQDEHQSQMLKKLKKDVSSELTNQSRIVY